MEPKGDMKGLHISRQCRKREILKDQNTTLKKEGLFQMKEENYDLIE